MGVIIGPHIPLSRGLARYLEIYFGLAHLTALGGRRRFGAMEIDKAIQLFGSQVGLANALGVTRQAVQQWVAKGAIPELRQYKLREVLAQQSPPPAPTPRGPSPD
jgi:hypothetical protein